MSECDLPAIGRRVGQDGTRQLLDDRHAEARLRFEGRLETGAKDGYGHLGRYTGQVTILRLLDATRENPRS